MTNPLYEEFFEKHRFSEKNFLFLKNKETISYKDYITSVERISFFFKKLGLFPGDRVALKLKKTPIFLSIYGACVHRGLIFLPLNDGYTNDELLYYLRDSESKLLITDKETSSELKSKKLDQGFIIETIEKDSFGSISKEFIKDISSEKPVSRNLNDIAAILYTSGTTGRSKGAMISQENLLSNAQTLTEYWHFNSEDNLIHALPIYHTHGLFVATNVILLSSASMFFLEKFELETIFNYFPYSTVLMGVPTFYIRLLDSKKLTKKIVKNVRLFISGSAPLTKEINDYFFDITGKRILERYGMTETNMISSNPYKGNRISGTVGYPLPGIKVRITHQDTGRLIEKGKIGEIQVKGKNVFCGYWGMPDKTANSFTVDNYFKTDDLGRFNKSGYLEIVGRLKDLIISGGFNIYPKEVEDVVNSIKGIKENAVIGVSHKDLGESVLCIIVKEHKVLIDSNLISEILRNKLAKYKCPKAFIFKNSLPKNNLGKILKNQLREEYKDYFK